MTPRIGCGDDIDLLIAVGVRVRTGDVGSDVEEHEPGGVAAHGLVDVPAVGLELQER